MSWDWWQWLSKERSKPRLASHSFSLSFAGVLEMESSSQMGFGERCGDEAYGLGVFDDEMSGAWPEMPRRRRGKLRREVEVEEEDMLPERRRWMAEGVVLLEVDE